MESTTRALIVLLVLYYTGSPLWAQQGQQKSSSAVSILHTPPQGSDLPYPGQILKLVVQLKNTKETTRKLRVALVSDGKFIDISAPGAYRDIKDQPTYDVLVNSPLAEIAYHFILYNQDGSVTVSPRYFLRRPCIPQVDLTAGTIDKNTQGVNRLQVLADESQKLENDLLSYDRLIALLEDLQKRVGAQ